MKPFFTAKEFEELQKPGPLDSFNSDGYLTSNELAHYCNAKLEREGKVVNGYKVKGMFRWDEDTHSAFDTHEALLINPKPLVATKGSGE